MSGTGIRIVDLPDLGTVTDASSVVAEKAGSGRLSALALRTYCTVGTLAEAPVNGLAYGRLNAAWQQVLPSTGGTITGDVIVNGYTTLGSSLTVGGVAYVASLAVSPVNSYEWRFFSDSSGNHVQQHRTGWYDLWESSAGMRYWAGSAGNLMTLDGGGNLVVSGNVAVTGYAAAPHFWVTGTSNTFGLSLGGSGRILNFMPSFYLDFAPTGPTGGTLQYFISSGPLWVMRAADDFCFNQQAAVGGNGAYLNMSDRRAKEGITPTTRGLTEVLQLEPVEFTRTDPTTGAPKEIGFVAQDVQPIVPEAVWQAGIPLKDGTGGLDDPNPTLAISEATITALNVNAIKELHSMISALTTRLAALEGTAA